MIVFQLLFLQYCLFVFSVVDHRLLSLSFFVHLSSHGEQEQISLRTFNFLLASWAKMKKKTERNWFRFGYPIRERCKIIANHSCSCWLLASLLSVERKKHQIGPSWQGWSNKTCLGNGVIPMNAAPPFLEGDKKRVMTAPLEAISSHYLRWLMRSYRTSAVVWPSLTYTFLKKTASSHSYERSFSLHQGF